jgi:proteic killer suppression protein
MRRTIRHKGLKRLFEKDDPSGVNREHADKLRDILATLHADVDYVDYH